MQTASEMDLNASAIRSPYLRVADAADPKHQNVGNVLWTTEAASQLQFSSDNVVSQTLKESHPQSTVSDEQFQNMVETQAQLAFRMVQNELSRTEILVLQMLRWAIAREEEARLGGQISEFERLANLHEKLASEIDRLLEVR